MHGGRGGAGGGDGGDFGEAGGSGVVDGDAGGDGDDAFGGDVVLAGDGDISVVGGAEIYDLFMPWATRIELTEVHEDTVGDVSMAYPGPEWIETAREERPADGRWPAHSFVTLERVG